MATAPRTGRTSGISSTGIIRNASAVIGTWLNCT
jgi:hypothetical protein